MRNILLKMIIMAFLLSFAAPALADDMSPSQLLRITQAGGSLVLDLDRRKYTVSELSTLASSLKFEATLTIRMGRKHSLNTAECCQIAGKNPGKVIFWF